MNREIKFRGKRVDNGEWIIGSLRIEGTSAYILTADYAIMFDAPDLNSVALGCGLEDQGITNRYEACEYGFREAVDLFYQHFPEWQEVDPAAVGQYIGLKDKNGVEICEGDIVKQCFCKEIGGYYEEYQAYEGFNIGEIVVIPSKGVCMKNPLQHLEVDGEIDQELVKTKMYKTVVSYRSEVIGNIHDNPDLLEGRPTE